MRTAKPCFRRLQPLRCVRQTRSDSRTSTADSTNMVRCQIFKTRVQRDPVVLRVRVTHVYYFRNVWPLAYRLIVVLDTFLRQLKDKACVKVIIAKPYGAGFQAMMRPQRQIGSLPSKIAEIRVHPEALHPPRQAYPFVAMALCDTKDAPTKAEDKSAQNSSTQNSSTPIIPGQHESTQSKALQINPTPSDITQQNPTQSDPIQDTSTLDLIPRNSRGQRVDPRVDGLAWLVADARRRNICYGYRLNDHCTSSPGPCPRTHLQNTLSIYQINPLQALAREVPCSSGNACQDWTCCFGHKCPFDGRCNKGNRCRFPREMHLTDLKIVRQDQ